MRSCDTCERELSRPATLRDRFAMAALTGMLASGEFDFKFMNSKSVMAEFSKMPYGMADAMLKAREAKQ